MSRFRSVAAACGLAGLIGLGVVAPLTRAQPPADQGGRAASPRQRLRERLVALRTDVALLQLDYEAQRAGLLELMKAARRGELTTLTERTHRLALTRRSVEGEATEREVSQRIKEAEGSFRVEQDRLAELIAVKRKEFATTTTRLSEKKLDLEDAERRYAEAR